MTTLQKIQSNLKVNIRGGLGSRDVVPHPINVSFYLGTIWCVHKNGAIYKDKNNYNYQIELQKLPENILININNQL